MPPIDCHPGELTQVFMNLILNASQAIAEASTGGRGKIRIAMRTSGPNALIEVTDSGPGIPESAREHLFDPFFTTKAPGKGTGQGLAIARSIVVDRHRGQLSFESTVGKGTTFVVALPLGASSSSGSAPQAVAA